MKKILFFLMVSFSVYSQEDNDDGMFQNESTKKEESIQYGKKYLEDQIYFGLTYNHLVSKATSVVQHNMSRGIHLGFLRDVPLNERRNMGVAVGLGYAYDLIYSNIIVFRENDQLDYRIVKNFDQMGISKNYFTTHTFELPIEFRWRTSTPDKFKFWRVYAGARLGYTFNATSLFKQNEITLYFDNSNLEKQWQFKVFSVFGYNAINFFIQYNLTPIFKNIEASDKTSLKASVLQMGLMFYIL